MHQITGDRFFQLLKLSICHKDLFAGKALHSLYIKSFIPPSVYISNHFIMFYAKCGYVLHAHQLFEEIPDPNIYSYNAIVSAYVNASQIHIARHLFDQIPQPDVVSYNTLISAYADMHDCVSASCLFHRLRENGMGIDGFTLSSMLTCCGDISMVKQMHSLILSGGFSSYVSVNNVLINGYSYNGQLFNAELLFYGAGCNTDEVTWNSMIVAYGQHREGSRAVNLLPRMVQMGLDVDMFTWASVFAACTCLGDLPGGSQFHARVIKIGLEHTPHTGSGLVDLYSKCGDILDAEKVFAEIPKRDLILWNTMISGYSQKDGFYENSLICFQHMHRECFRPDDCSFACVISACSDLMSPTQGRQLHALAIKHEIPSDMLSVKNALIAMYSKCGKLKEAMILFHEMEKKNTVSFNSMISGYAQHGLGGEAVNLFEEMLETNNRPSSISFVSVLSACAHSGRITEGWRYFNSMLGEFRIEPEAEHYTCMVDLLGRAGRLKDVEKMIEKALFNIGMAAWLSVLRACRTYGNIELGEKAADEILKREPSNASTYVVMANIYASAGKWEKVVSLRKLMRERGVKKQPGYSWLEVKKEIHVFLAHDTKHPRREEVYRFLEEMQKRMKDAGYIPDMSWAPIRDYEEEDDREMRLGHHSEKLAIAFGLISTNTGEPVLVIKNLRICGDCHNAVKIISAVTGRDITVRDTFRFHHFHGGICSCNDYW